MIDLEAEELIPLADLAGHVPAGPGGVPVATVTLRRWASTGVKGVVLDTVMVGGRRMTSLAAFRRFVAAGNPAKSVARPDTSRAAQRVSRELDARGW